MVVPTFCFAGRLSITMSAHCRSSHWRWAGGRGVKGGPLARLRLYEWIIEKKFPSWIRSSFGVRKRTVYLLQDHEKALWAEEPRAAMVTHSPRRGRPEIRSSNGFAEQWLGSMPIAWSTCITSATARCSGRMIS